MKVRIASDPIDLMRQLRFKYAKETNYQMNKYTRQIRRTTRQLINKYKAYFKGED
jgi:hypothetical protein